MSLPRPLFSVITVCKNSSRTIRQTIESVLSQDAELEYIVIDGASDDGTGDVVRSYGDRISTFVSEPDGGIADAFNKGIRRASGEIVALLNSDDSLLPGTLGRVAEFFRGNPDVDVLHGDVLFFRDGVFLKRIAPPRHWWYPWRMSAMNVHAATFVRRRVYLEHGPFDTGYRYAMDDDLFFRWVRAGVTIRYVPETFTRVAEGGVSGRNPMPVFLEKRRALLRHGYPRIPADLQFIGRWVLQAGLTVWDHSAGKFVRIL